jgi:TRAP-type C4-dicarboxylate transport system substrate-binding protein
MVGLVLFCAGSLLLISQPAAAKKITIKAVSAWPKNAVEVANDYLPFIEAANARLAEKYPGELEIKYMGGPEVIPSKDQPEALRMGTIHMLFGTPAYYNGIAPAANAGKLSKLNSAEEKKVGADAIFDQIHRDKLNAAYLGRLGSEVEFQLYTLKPVKTLSDLKGLRIRTSTMYLDFLKALETAPVAIKPGDVYQALERGVVDGVMWPLYSVRPWGWQEVLKYVVGPSFYKVAHPILMNAKRWDATPAHLQEELTAVLVEEAQRVDAASLAHMKEERKLLEEAGLEFVAFSTGDTEKYLDMAYRAGWAGQMKFEPEKTAKLQKLLNK